MVLRGEMPRLVDEWQEAPAIWDSARYAVDAADAAGMFIFTGSRAPRLGSVRHSGAGRVHRVRMSTLTLFESKLSSGIVSLRELCLGNFSESLCPEMKLEDIVAEISTGGWPLVHRNRDSHTGAARDYIEYTINQAAQTGGVDAFKLKVVLASLARNESQPVANTTIANDVARVSGKKIAPQTLNKYLALLERFYLVDPVRPLALNLRSSANALGRDKLRFFDPAIACSLLGSPNPATLFNDLRTLGFLFESLCIRDLKVYAQSFGGEVRYYRDSWGNEVDAAVVLPDGSWSAFEIKLSAEAAERAAQKLKALADGVPDASLKPRTLAVIVPVGKAAYRLPNGVLVVPITALRP